MAILCVVICVVGALFLIGIQVYTYNLFCNVKKEKEEEVEEFTCDVSKLDEENKE